MEKKLHEILPPNSLPENRLGYVAVLAAHQDGWVVVRLKGQNSWAFPGGRIEPGETAMEAARRELYEETGALEFSMDYVGQYSVLHGEKMSFGNFYTSNISILGPLPESEIAEVQIMGDFPVNNTRFPQINPQLFHHFKKLMD